MLRNCSKLLDDSCFKILEEYSKILETWCKLWNQGGLNAPIYWPKCLERATPKYSESTPTYLALVEESAPNFPKCRDEMLQDQKWELLRNTLEAFRRKLLQNSSEQTSWPCSKMIWSVKKNVWEELLEILELVLWMVLEHFEAAPAWRKNAPKSVQFQNA